MKNQRFSFGIFTFVIAAAGVHSCTVEPHRYYYDFAHKQLQEKPVGTPGAKELVRPVPYKASKDLQIVISNFNPLKYELSTRDSFSSFFLADTGKLSALVTVPTLPKLAEGDEKKAAVDARAGVAAVPYAPLGNSLQHKIAGMGSSDCEILKGFMYSFNLQKSRVQNAITDYKTFLAKAGSLNDVYDYLRKGETLDPSVVSSQLAGNFIATINAFAPAADQLSTTPSLVSSRQITHLEDLYYSKVIAEDADLLQLQQDADALKGDCPGFIELYKKFSASVSALKDKITEFKSNRAEKILPAFSKSALLYDEMKQYLVSVPDYTTSAVTIEHDFDNILLYKKDLSSGAVSSFDQISVEPTKGWKIDVAGGLFVSGVHDERFSRKSKDSIYTKQYLLSGVARDTTVQETFTSIYEHDQAAVSYGGMVYLQAHTQNASWFNYGLFIGIGALFNDEARWAGSGGFSLLIGKKQRFVINPGILVAQVESLSPPYQTKTWYRETLDNIPTDRDTKVSWMLGIAWNFK